MVEDVANVRGRWRKEDYRNEGNINHTIHEEIALNVAGISMHQEVYTRRNEIDLAPAVNLMVATKTLR
jgi:hypothetical protein